MSTLPAGFTAARHPTPLGPVLLAATPRGLAGLWFEDQRHHPDTTGWPIADEAADGATRAVLAQARAELDGYFAGTCRAFTVPLDPLRGTPFQRAVWAALQAVPRGAPTTYGALARALGSPAAVRAVGAAVGRNPLSVVVPCHRVVGSDGSLTGYAGGLARKRALLALEAAA
jgi:methylated-DNA-[protein]-cysteine S-methyltransferase